MYNIAWYARDGHLDLFPLISARLKEEGIDFSSHYICHNEVEREHLHSVYNIKKPVILATELKEMKNSVDSSRKKVRLLEKKYNAMPLVRCLWSSVFERNLSEEIMARYLVSHIEFWEKFLKTNKINALVSEMPSILSTCVAWIVCKKLNVDFISFINIPIDERIIISTSWNGHFDDLEEKIDEMKIDKDSANYRKSVEYLKRMELRPKKTEEALSQLEKGMRFPIHSVEKILNFPNSWKRYRQRREYYTFEPISSTLLDWFSFYSNFLQYNLSNVFEKNLDLEKESYFLFPLHTFSEWSTYSWAGLAYGDQTTIIKQVMHCLPVGCKLYVKEHTSNLGEKPLSFYRFIKKLPNVRLVHPFEDTFKLVRHSEGIVTLGSTVGFEAFLMKKPVIVLGEPWYENLPGIHKAASPEILAELLQNVSELKTATDEEKLKAVFALYNLSFEGVRCPHKNALKPENITRFAKAFAHRIKKAQKENKRSRHQ